MPINRNIFNPPVMCCCQFKKEDEFLPTFKVIETLLYKLAYTVWHVAFYIENKLKVNVIKHLFVY